MPAAHEMDTAKKPTTVPSCGAADSCGDETASIDRTASIEVFERLDDALDRPQTICLIGAAAVLSLGHAARQTGEIDVWRLASSIDDRILTRAGKAAGISFDDRSDTPAGIDLQIIRPGIVQLSPNGSRGPSC